MRLQDIQKLMADLYLKRDKQRGLERTLLWFLSEVGEVADIIVKNDPKELSKNKTTLAFELADCLAWLCSISNILNIDLEKALLSKYPFKCSHCKQNPCECSFK
ncbi:MAG: MazG nucleotide pyrophosphohydrolase domain-containing protein [Candidatus Hodarchaeales archaeon]|jgi:NTP pyrophosphatase (non-canonical NTP hydrolase)